MLKYLKYILAGLLLVLLISAFLTYSYRRSDYVQYVRYLPNYELKYFPPKVLVYSSLTSEYLIDHARELHADFGFDGFILTQLPASSWPGNYQQLLPLTSVVKKGNAAAAKQGLKYNFLKIGLETGDIGLWQDDEKWRKDLNELQKVAAWAKKTGFRGIALDTETYHQIIWNNGLERNKLPNIRELIKKRGFQTADAVLRGFPDAELLVIMEGHLYAYKAHKPHKYAYWIDYFNGLLQARPSKGLSLMVERTYKVTDQLKLKSYYKDIRGEIIGDNVDDPKYWLDKGDICFGLWPLGREYDDKKANYSAEAFKEQFNSAIQYCPRYVWIYAHGLSWWQVKDPQKYGFNPQEAPLPSAKDIEKYKEIIRKAKNPELKLFYREIKYNKKFTWLDIMLEKILKVE